MAMMVVVNVDGDDGEWNGEVTIKAEKHSAHKHTFKHGKPFDYEFVRTVNVFISYRARARMHSHASAFVLVDTAPLQYPQS